MQGTGRRPASRGRCPIMQAATRVWWSSSRQVNRTLSTSPRSSGTSGGGRRRRRIRNPRPDCDAPSERTSCPRPQPRTRPRDVGPDRSLVGSIHSGTPTTGSGIDSSAVASVTIARSWTGAAARGHAARPHLPRPPIASAVAVNVAVKRPSSGLAAPLGVCSTRERLEGRVGFEPTTRGLKVPCSAAELPAPRT